ncbi:hypothetical protein [Pseudanabaena minima]|uniref:hypothetical protein n=1 Tax=Pseudanabaena minima TaxID=890415 RepID=UPI003DAA4206
MFHGRNYIIYIITGLIFLLGGEVQSKTKQQRDYCDLALDKTQSKLRENRRRINVDFKPREITRQSDWYEGMPSDRPYELWVIMRGSESDMSNVMHSKQFLTTLAANIITNCDRVSVVTFGINSTDYLRSYGLINNKVTYFKCIDRETFLAAQRISSRVIYWGRQLCI